MRAFLTQKAVGPEQDALLSVLHAKHKPNETNQREDEKTPSFKLGEEYIKLGGRGRAKVDDNTVSTRKWEDEPAQAQAFWETHVEPLDDKQRQGIEIHLPSISDD